MAKPSTDGTTVTRRPRKDPSAKASDSLAKAQKDYDKAVERFNKLNSQIDAAEAEVDRAERYLNFAKANPDLPSDETAPAPAEETPAQ